MNVIFRDRSEEVRVYVRHAALFLHWTLSISPHPHGCHTTLKTRRGSRQHWIVHFLCNTTTTHQALEWCTVLWYLGYPALTRLMPWSPRHTLRQGSQLVRAPFLCST